MSAPTDPAPDSNLAGSLDPTNDDGKLFTFTCHEKRSEERECVFVGVGVYVQHKDEYYKVVKVERSKREGIWITLHLEHFFTKTVQEISYHKSNKITLLPPVYRWYLVKKIQTTTSEIDGLLTPDKSTKLENTCSLVCVTPHNQTCSHLVLPRHLVDKVFVGCKIQTQQIGDLEAVIDWSVF